MVGSSYSFVLDKICYEVEQPYEDYQGYIIAFVSIGLYLYIR